MDSQNIEFFPQINFIFFYRTKIPDGYFHALSPILSLIFWLYANGVQNFSDIIFYAIIYTNIIATWRRYSAIISVAYAMRNRLSVGI